MRVPSIKQAEWIHKYLGDDYEETVDDVYDALLGNITFPRDFVAEVQYLAQDYADELRKNNGL